MGKQTKKLNSDGARIWHQFLGASTITYSTELNTLVAYGFYCTVSSTFCMQIQWYLDEMKGIDM